MCIVTWRANDRVSNPSSKNFFLTDFMFNFPSPFILIRFSLDFITSLSSTSSSEILFSLNAITAASTKWKFVFFRRYCCWCYSLFGWVHRVGNGVESEEENSYNRLQDYLGRDSCHADAKRYTGMFRDRSNKPTQSSKSVKDSLKGMKLVQSVMFSFHFEWKIQRPVPSYAIYVQCFAI